MLEKIDNILLLGTSHVAVQSSREIRRVIEEEEPELVAIELDYNRLKKLLSPKGKKDKPSFFRMVREFGFAGSLFALLGSSVQERVGKALNIEPGIDMKTAYLEARERKIVTALIDQDIRIVLKKISRLSFSRKVSMFFRIFRASFKKEYRNKLNFDVRDGVPDAEFIENAMEVLRKETPDFYKILIDDRNRFMVDKIMRLRENHKGKILVVVGAGHVRGMKKLIEARSPSNNYSFSFRVENY